MTKSVKPDHNRERFFENLDKMPFDKAVHITILIISLGLFIYSKSNSADQASSTLGEMEVMSFNELCLYKDTQMLTGLNGSRSYGVRYPSNIAQIAEGAQTKSIKCCFLIMIMVIYENLYG